MSGIPVSIDNTKLTEKKAGFTNVDQIALNLICSGFKDVIHAYIVKNPGSVNEFNLNASFPEDTSVPQSFVNTGRLCWTSSAPVVCGSNAGQADVDIMTQQLAVPIMQSDQIQGVLAFEVRTSSKNQQQLLEKLQTQTVWLTLLWPTVENSEDSTQAIADLLLISARAHSAGSAMHSIATGLADIHHCQRVWIGKKADRTLTVCALSNNLNFDRRTELVTAAENSMQECIEMNLQGYKPQENSELPARAHLSELTGGSSIFSKVIQGAEGSFIIFMFERDKQTGFKETETETIEQQSEQLSSVIHLQMMRERSVINRLLDKNRLFFQRWVSSAYMKLTTLLIIGLLLFLGFAKSEFRISANATLEGAIQRSVVAPYDGYVQTASVRAGQVVSEGELLAELDNTDLRLEIRKAEGEVAEIEKQYRKATASQERAQARILNAQLDQAIARLELLQEQASRSHLYAPMDGLVIAGDLSRSLGSPVSRGDVLFVVAPLDSYRVSMDVEGKDIQWIKTGQTGHLVLSSMPDKELSLKVKQISRVASVNDKQSGFLVEAELTDMSGSLRPGMEGIGKINVAERRLIWIWTRNMIDWLQYQMWIWNP